MEFAQFHSFERKSVEGVTAELRAILAPGWLHPRAEVGVAVHGPWRPADRWPDALERLVWTVGVESRGPILSARGEAGVVRGGIERRKAPAHPVEALAERAGDGLVLVHSDATCLAYVAVYRQRKLAWSLLLQDRVRLVRCDGQVVQVAEPPRFVPEGDRVGVLLAGLQQWLREPVSIPDEERYTLADDLGALTGEAEPTWIIRDGAFLVEADATRRASASG
jgi:hypothetical protein